jgi:phosphoribosylformylglycinamidine synthase
MAVAVENVCGGEVFRVWHGDASLPEGLDFIALPGGFSYGDYLRSGAMAARSPVMQAVIAAANRGVAVLGVCNGFQVLTEAGLLPGALMRNAGIRFVCREVALKVENTSIFTSRYMKDQRITIPVAHHDGNFLPTTPRWTASRAKAAWPSAMPRRSTVRRGISRACSMKRAMCWA